MNVRRLKQVAKDILNHPKQFDIDSWFNTDKRDENGCLIEVNGLNGTNGMNPMKNCGTTACIAGWGMARYTRVARPVLKQFQGRSAAMRTDTYGYFSFDANYTAEARAGRKVFELTPTQSNRLFFVDRWPEKFRDRYYAVRTNRSRAKIAYDRILHFIATGGKE